MKLASYLTPYMKTDLEWSKDLYKRPGGIKLEENIGKILLDLGMAMIFFDMIQKYKQQNKNNKWDYFKLKIFTTNVTISKMKRHPVEYDKVFVNHLFA